MEKEIKTTKFQRRPAGMKQFLWISKSLFEEEPYRKLSSDAKLLYAIICDRTFMSYDKDWIDKNGEPYIVLGVEEIMGIFKCSKGKAIKMIAELDQENGVGLITKKRRGLGKPNAIYVN